MVFLVLSIVFISTSAVVFRLSADRGASALEVNAVFRLVGGVLALCLLAPGLKGEAISELPAQVWAWALTAGAFYWLAGFANLRASGLGHLGITWTVSRSAMVIPTLASMLIWHEVALRVDSPGMWMAIGGTVLTLAALVAFGLDRMNHAMTHGSSSRRWYIWLAASFLFQGGWELTLRAAGGFGNETYRLAYICIAFTVAMVLSLISLAAMRRLPSRLAVKFGILAGLCTVVGTGTRPWALRDLPGIVVFPATAVGVILLTQGASAWWWKTRLGRWGYAGMVAAVLGVIILSLASM